MQRVVGRLSLLCALLLAGTAQAVDRQQVLSQAPNAISGTLTAKPTADAISITPYGATAPTTLSLGPNATAFLGNQEIPLKTLSKGGNVTLHYATTSDKAARVDLVDVLNREQATAEQAKPQQLATAGAAAPAAGATAAPPAASAATKLEQDADARSQGSQAGRILTVEQGVVSLDPYQRAAGNARLVFANDAQVFRGDQVLSIADVKQGSDVRVYFDNQAGTLPKVVAIEILPPDQAAMLEKAERDVPRQNP